MNKYNEQGQLNEERKEFPLLSENAPFVRDAPDPSNIIWENQSITPRMKYVNKSLS
jgi:hypothetical protein